MIFPFRFPRDELHIQRHETGNDVASMFEYILDDCSDQTLDNCPTVFVVVVESSSIPI
jgi:hypothetical protein